MSHDITQCILVHACLQEKLSRDRNHENVQGILRELVDECLKRPPSAEDANSIAGQHPNFFPRTGSGIKVEVLKVDLLALVQESRCLTKLPLIRVTARLLVT